MTQIILSGCCGKMGRMISRCVSDRTDCVISAGIDISGQELESYPVFMEPSDCTEPADVLVDFSHPNALEPLLAFAIERRLPAVIATTGLTPLQVEKIHAAAKVIPVFYTANMSLGISLLCELAKKAATILGNDFDIEIIEKHHNLKIDAPSGTALMLADEISTALPVPPIYTYDRHSQRKKRDKREIGLHAVRGGTIVGEHEILFAGRDEMLTLTHTATSKEVFATGSINAALFLAKQKAGLYTMGDLVSFA